MSGVSRGTETSRSLHGTVRALLPAICRLIKRRSLRQGACLLYRPCGHSTWSIGDLSGFLDIGYKRSCFLAIYYRDCTGISTSITRLTRMIEGSHDAVQPCPPPTRPPIRQASQRPRPSGHDSWRPAAIVHAKATPMQPAAKAYIANSLVTIGIVPKRPDTGGDGLTLLGTSDSPFRTLSSFMPARCRGSTVEG